MRRINHHDEWEARDAPASTQTSVAVYKREGASGIPLTQLEAPEASSITSVQVSQHREQ